MAWALKFDGVNDFVSSSTYSNTAGSTLEIKFKTDGIPQSFALISYAHDRTYAYVRFNSSGDFRAKGVQTGVNTTLPNGVDIFDGEWHTLKVHYFANTHQFEIDGHLSAVIAGDVSYSSWKVIGAYTAGYLSGQIEYVKWTNNSTNYNWEATASDHSAGTPILVDTIGGNNATGYNMPTDGSAWVDLGGNSINTLQYGSDPVIDVKYYNGVNLIDVVLQMNGELVWQV